MAKNRSFGKAAKSSRPSGKAANALGYAKRQTLKSKALSPGDIGDVYEYQQEKVRRAKVKLQLEKDEILGAGGAESGSEDDEERGSKRKRDMKPRLVGENDDDDGIGEDEDEEIDSDEAFEESDEERFAGFSFSHKKKAKSKAKPKKRAGAVRFAEVDLNEDSDGAKSELDEEEASEGNDDEDEDDEDEEEGDPEDFLDVLDVLDGRANLEGEEVNPEAGKARTSSQQQEAAQPEEKGDEDEEMGSGEDEEDDEEDDDDDEEDDDDQMLSPSEDEGDESALQELESFVTGLDAGQKRKAPDDEDSKDAADAKRARKRRLLPERTEAGAENEFIASSGAGKVNLDDLLAPLEAQSSNLQSLKKSAKVLASNSGKVKTLSAPLPQRTAEKLDREAAYEQTKEEVDKWKAAMQRIKEAEHLSFPLQAEPKSRTSNLELAAKFKPVTELESAVDKLLKSAKMRENEIAQTESLKMNHLSVEEVAARRAELAKMRDLMFRAEAKAKRIAKIKSKTYRRLKKKERARLAEKLGENEEDLDDEEAQLKREVERARERATLRHKNTGKWAKAMRARGELDEDQRRDINEMLDRGEKLRRKIRGEGESGDEDESDDESDMEDGEEGISRIKSKAFDELAALEANEPEAPEGKKGKSIFEMKFMKDAMAREQRKAHEIEEEGEGGDHHEGDGPSGAVIQRTGGRAVYRPGALNTNIRPTGSLASDTSSVTLKST
ncbi:Utp14-domain-containing protein, partial [Trametes sanguinea]